MLTAQPNTPDCQSQRKAQTSFRNRLRPSGLNLDTTGADRPVQTAQIEDQSRLVAALVLAFSADPANRWMYPAPDSYLRHFPAFVMALGGRAFACGTAHFIGDVQAAALWLPPGAQPDEEALMALLHDGLSEEVQRDLTGIFDQMGSYHPHEPHWYLPWIGVDPAQQRKGLGSTLLTHALRACDAAGTPAYLESSNPENIPLYQRHGFEVMGTIQVGTSPPITPMLRHPR
jgi:ribosomal protein S18 acetylase RimI-like enzyme